VYTESEDSNIDSVLNSREANTDQPRIDRRYSWKLHPTAQQDARLHEQARMCTELWNALLEIDFILQNVRAWVFDKDALGPLVFDLAGNLRVVSLADILLRRQYGLRTRAEHLVTAIGAAGAIQYQPGQDIRTRLPSAYDRGYWITQLRDLQPEWLALSTWTPRQVSENLAKAWKHCFTPRAKRIPGRKYGAPRFKSLANAFAIPHRFASGCRLEHAGMHERSWWLYLDGVSDQKLWRRGRGRGDVWARGKLPSPALKWTDADVRHVDGHWEISAAVVMEQRRTLIGRGIPITVEFCVIGGLALVNNEQVELVELIKAQELDVKHANMQREFDRNWPRNKRWTDDEWNNRCEDKAEIGRLASHIARVRRNALHVWTKQLVERASVLTIIKPASIKDFTQTARGNVKNWGAAVEIVSEINRDTLSHAPAMAVQMLEYKAEELGIPCQVIEDDTPEISISKAFVASRKVSRRSARETKKGVSENEKD